MTQQSTSFFGGTSCSFSGGICHLSGFMKYDNLRKTDGCSGNPLQVSCERNTVKRSETKNFAPLSHPQNPRLNHNRWLKRIIETVNDEKMNLKSMTKNIIKSKLKKNELLIVLTETKNIMKQTTYEMIKTKATKTKIMNSQKLN